MTVTLVVKSTVIDNVSDTDSAIAALLNAVTYTSIYGAFCIPISNTRSRIMVLYA